MILSHQIRLVPTEKQEAYFRRACGTARFTYNWALAAWQKAYQSGQKPSGRKLKVEFNALRKSDLPWTYEVHRDCTSQPFENIQRAFVSFFRKKSRYPRFKRKHGRTDSFYISNDKISLNGDRVRIPVLGWVKMRESLRFDGKIQAATVRRIADKWFLSVQVDVGSYQKSRTDDGLIGIDLGINYLAVLSTGEKVENPRPLRKALKRLRRLSKQYSRKVKNSSNQRKVSLKLARLHYRISSIRRNVLHNLTTRLCRENQAIGIEDLAVKNMMRNHKLARSISDTGFGEFRRQIEYKSKIYETIIQVFNRFYPSSKACSNCGLIKDTLDLSERKFRCECGFTADRDVNAAINLIPRVTREFTPANIGALAQKNRPSETPVVETGIFKRAI